MNSKKELVIVACPPYPEYEDAPEDQSVSDLFDCPKCDGKMWLSQKKKGVIMFSSCIGRDILLGCYDCITKIAKEDPNLFLKSKKMRL